MVSANVDDRSVKPASGGPHGVGDPSDKSLRRVEREVLIPKIMRDRAKVEKCAAEVKAFEECCKEHSLLMVFSCRKQNDFLRSCLTASYTDEQFKSECKDIYLKERSEFRTTGVMRNSKSQADKAK